MKTIAANVYCFDVEWVPCLRTARLVLEFGADSPDDQIREALWRRAGATTENPRPFLKLALSRVVSISAVHRHQAADGTVTLAIKSFPEVAGPEVHEGNVIGSFLNEVARCRAQLVGFNSAGADLPVLIQRGLAGRCRCPEFGNRPDKPWEGADYFSRFAEMHIDLAQFLAPGSTARGAAMPSLNEIAAALLIPGKLDHSGGGVLDLWLQGDYAALTGYNETDACTTYLLWLRLAYLCGKFTPAGMQRELEAFRALLRGLVPTKSHFARFLNVWSERSAMWQAEFAAEPGVPSDRIIAELRRTGERCEIRLNRNDLAPDVWARIERHIAYRDPSRHYLTEIGCDANGTVTHGFIDQMPVLLKVDSPDVAGVVRAVTAASVHGVDEWVDPHAA